MNASARSDPIAAAHLARLRKVNARLARAIRRLTRELAATRHFATHDSLTGLPNRRLLLDRLGQALAHAARYRKHVMLLLVDLDEFKNINDRHGHRIGDELLKQVAERLLACVRSCDTVSRYGGDEFVVMLPQIDAIENARVVCEKIRARLAVPYTLGEQSIRAGASIGAAVYGEDGRTTGELIDRADAAMYVDKILRRSTLSA
jgi:diguanylate cyclase (GGDEF)-like protein